MHVHRNMQIFFSVEDDDYVDRDVGISDDYILSDAVLHELTSEQYGCASVASCSTIGEAQHSGGNFVDSRSSQFFETIQENISGRSSRASSG